MAVSAWIGLYACALYLPGIGQVVARCPIAGLSTNSSHEMAALEVRLLDLRAQAALLAPCDDTIIVQPEVQRASEVVVLLDTSGSMKWSKKARPVADEAYAIVELLNTNSNHPNRAALERERDEAFARAMEQNIGEPVPIEIARETLRPLLERTSEAVSVSLWRYDTCTTDPVRLFPSGERSAAEVLDDEMNAAGSPLMRSISRVEAIIAPGAGRTPEKAVNVLLFADGEDNCGNNEPVAICNTARRVKQAFPYVYIHVVTLDVRLETLRCIARETGGQAVQSDDLEKVRSIALSIVRESN